MNSKNVKGLIAHLAERESDLKGSTFIAPCVAGGRIRASIDGLVQTFRPKPRDFEGWGIFQRMDERTATLVEEAGLPLVSRYLELMSVVRVRLASPLRGRSWLAFPVNESDFRQRIGPPRPITVHLVDEGGQFEAATTRWDGSAFWYQEIDRKADPRIAERLREAARSVTDPAELKLPNATPEEKTAYLLAAQQNEAFAALIQQRREMEALRSDGQRLANALHTGGGELREFRDRGDYWQVEWTTRDGEHHSSAISKRDLTVISSGVCLSDRDSDFDLQSLVGVMERREDEW